MTNSIIMTIPEKPALSYEIHIAAGLINHPNKWLPSDWQNKILVIITDDNVNKLYGQKLFNNLVNHGVTPLLLTFTPGENSKNNNIKQYLEEKMLAYGCNRHTIILALGGGVVGDIAGFIAATYMRGISYIQVPTTVLAMVDSSIGGKTSVNNCYGKNLIGAFWHPQSVVIDLDCINTLSEDHLINGIIEALKMFIIMDELSLTHAMNNLDQILKKDSKILTQIIETSIKLKINVVRNDEQETHQRMILNFGHTIGHAIEKILNYEILHGYAVALGIIIEAKIAQLLDLLQDSDYDLIKTLFKKLNIDAKFLKSMKISELIRATKNDKKSIIEGQQSKARYVLLKKIGQTHQDHNVYAHHVSDDIVKQAFSIVLEE